MTHAAFARQYLQLLSKAEKTENRKEAISLINQATILLNRKQWEFQASICDIHESLTSSEEIESSWLMISSPFSNN